MKTRIIIFLAVLSAMMIAAPQVFALEIQVDNYGTVRFYQDGVLGKSSSDKPTAVSKQPLRTMPAHEQLDLHVNSSGNKNIIELKEKTKNYGEDSLVKTQTMETERVKIEFPAQMTHDQIEVAREKRELKKVEVEEKIENHRDEVKEKFEEKQQQREEYMQQLHEKRQERKNEVVELKNSAQEKRLELKSKHVKAALEHGAEFILDPATNEVTVTSPSGQEHTLNHLPDQALERMEAAGLFSNEGIETEEEVGVETNDQGELVYKKKDKIKKRAFGLFPYQVDSEIILNDSTGEVIEQQAAPNSMFEQLLNSVSL